MLGNIQKLLNEIREKEQLVNNIIAFLLEKESMSQKKIQKLTYYIYALNYAINDDENAHFHNIELEFEAWVHGPVNMLMYQELKTHRYNKIKKENSAFKETDYRNYFNDEEIQHMNTIYNAFGSLSADQLEYLTHQEKPWIEQREGLGELTNSHNIISTTTMKEYYIEKYGN